MNDPIIMVLVHCHFNTSDKRSVPCLILLINHHSKILQAGMPLEWITDSFLLLWYVWTTFFRQGYQQTTWEQKQKGYLYCPTSVYCKVIDCLKWCLQLQWFLVHPHQWHYLDSITLPCATNHTAIIVVMHSEAVLVYLRLLQGAGIVR